MSALSAGRVLALPLRRRVLTRTAMTMGSPLLLRMMPRLCVGQFTNLGRPAIPLQVDLGQPCGSPLDVPLQDLSLQLYRHSVKK
mmetsp:Transcript_89325/g.241351  ORF Transcript_89325/g.241351 Transcript_89325/m.241351 type:complete len:84 (+) Transcript_89325:599-850(+)